MQKIILASGSPRRKELLEGVFKHIVICPGSFEEDNTRCMEPTKLAMDHGLGKAKDVAKGFDSGIVIGCDTIVVLDGKVIGKPIDENDAKAILNRINGQEVEVISGLAIIDIDSGQTITDSVTTKVLMKRMTDEQIEKYIAMGEPLDKAGAFAAQGVGSLFIERIDGCFFNVVGLPLNRLYSHLEKLGVDVFDYRDSCM